MGRYKTVMTDARGDLICVPEIPDPISAGSVSARFCNFCVYHEDRDTGQVHVDKPCGLVSTGCGLDTIYIYRHELPEYRARAIVAKMNYSALVGGA